ncbi:protein LOW PSII ACCUMULATION 2, chloroplastic [Quercus lobata]|uniref:Protein LOW PSII ACCUMULATION 2, chloroplastic n=1 Tax=Quercus lobata TaxID=97700 RepID=A0A7N2MJ78_QUELO|nr:protein LOW PSII ACCUMULATION 2, chloroplastic [Quercus lobata]
MALHLHPATSFTKKPYHHHLPHTPHLNSPTRLKLIVKSQNPSETQKPNTNLNETTSEPTPPKKTSSPGLGFGSSSSSSPSSKLNLSASVTSNKKQKSKKERASIIRRSPVEKPAAFVDQEDKSKAKENSRNESAFLLTWLGLGAIILVEGIALAASGFLPEEWDKFFVKYLYPSFTPTVFLFVAGTVAYGVLKYLQNENLGDQK